MIIDYNEVLENKVAELERELEKYRYDSITGLKGRIDFNAQFKLLWDSSDQFYLTLADVNSLKAANTISYETGDQLLRDSTEALSECSPSGKDHLYRLGGDEFTMLNKFNRGFRSEDFNCESDIFTIATVCSTDFTSRRAMFNAVDNLLLQRKAELYKDVDGK